MSKALDTADWGQFQPKRKNLIINGNMSIWQRGIVFAAIANGDYSADRWQWAQNTTASVTLSKGSAVADLPFWDTLSMAVDTADAAIGASEFAGLLYKIEGNDLRTLKPGQASAKTVTLSFWHAHTKTGTHSVGMRNSAGNRSYLFEYTQAIANTWEKHIETFTLDTTGTWLLDESSGMSLLFGLAVGTAFHSTTGSWQAGNFFGTAGSVNNLDSTSNVFRISGVQMEVGEEATDLEYRHFAEEVTLCQRYYENSYDWINGFYPGAVSATGGGSYLDVNTASTILYGLDPAYAIQKRSTPTITFYSFSTGAAGNIRNVTTSADVPISSISNVGLRQIPTVIATGVQTITHKLYAMWEADAEL